MTFKRGCESLGEGYVSEEEGGYNVFECGERRCIHVGICVHKQTMNHRHLPEYKRQV